MRDKLPVFFPREQYRRSDIRSGQSISPAALALNGSVDNLFRFAETTP